MYYEDDNYSYWAPGTEHQIRYHILGETNGGSGSCITGNSTGTGGNLDVDVRGRRLAKIETDLEKIEFVANSKRIDVVGYNTNTDAKYLNEIKISPKNSSVDYCKSYLFEHTYWTDPNNPFVSASVGKRLRLNKITEKSCNSVGGQITLEPYVFDYEGDESSLPNRLSKAIDHWGFYNGETSNVGQFNMPPLPTGFPITLSPAPNSNRETNEIFLKKGILAKITYPTKGYTSFEFEANKGTVFDIKKPFTNSVNTPFGYIDATNSTVSSSSPFKRTYSVLNNLTFTQTEIDYGLMLLEYQSDDNNISKAEMSLINSNNLVIGTISISTDLTSKIKGLKLKEISNLQIGEVYSVVVIVDAPSSSTNDRPKGTFYCSIPHITIQNNQIIGGLRIKKIKNFESPAATVAIEKTYEYSTKYDPNISSGVVVTKPEYVKMIVNPKVVTNIPVPIGMRFTSFVFSEYPVVPLSDFDGYHIKYTRVIEKSSISSTNYNGFTEYNFFPPTINVSVPKMINLPIFPNASSGKEISSEVYKVNNNQIELIAKDEYKPDDSKFIIPLVQTLSFKYISSPTCNIAASGGTVIGISHYYFTNYSHYTYQYRLKEVKGILDNLETNTSYTYSENHTLPITSTTLNSDGKAHVKQTTFTFDLSSGSIKNECLSKNYLLPIKEEYYVGEKRVGGINTVLGFYNKSTGLLSNTPSNAYIRPYKLVQIDQCNCDNDNRLNLISKYDSNSGLIKEMNVKELSSSIILSYDPTTKLLTEKSYLDHKWKYDYYPNTNLVSKITDIDGQYTTYEYDALMRLKKINGKFVNATTPAITTDITYNYGFNGSTPNNYINNKVTITNSPTNIEQESRTYFDGLGRDIQTIKGEFGGTTATVFNNTRYDAVGRVSQVMEPQTGYGSLAYFPNVGSNTTTTYEASPLNRPIQTTSPLGFKNTIIYGANTAADNVKQFDKNGVFLGYYAENLLTKVETRDGNTNASATPNLTVGEITFTFKDKLGRTILMRKRYSNTSNNTAADFADTYYVYDDRGNLVFVLPPDASDGTSPLAFKYTYNCRNLLIKKQVPDGGKTEYWYNNKDQMIGTINANAGNVITQYDAYGRIVKTGSGFITPYNCTENLEEGDILIDPDNGGLGAVSYPNTCACNVIPDDTQSPTIEHVYTETFYDGNQKATGQLDIEKGKVTKQIDKILTSANVTGAGNAANFVNDKIETTYTYDAFGRIATTSVKNQYNETETIVNTYKNNGSDWIDNSLYTHKYKNSTGLNQIGIKNSLTYDKWGRINEQKHQINSLTERIITKNAYDYRGLLSTKHLNYLGGTPVSWQELNYTYNNQGWLTQINQPLPENDKFATCQAVDCGCNSLTGLRFLDSTELFLKQTLVNVKYNANALNLGSKPTGELMLKTDFQLVNTNGEERKYVIENTVKVGGNSPFEDIYDSEINFVINHQGFFDVEDLRALRASFILSLQEKLNEKANLNEAAYIAVVDALQAKFETQTNTLKTTMQNSAVASPATTPVVDLFYEQLYFNDATNTSINQYNGNIGQVIWQVTDRQKHAYQYAYDRLNRVTRALYYDITSAGGFDATDRYSELFSYDKRGNLLTKSTNGIKYSTTDLCYKATPIDALNYNYNSQSNRIATIIDGALATDKSRGFNPGTTTATNPYLYDNAGNLINDKYKDLIIKYNYLNLPYEFFWNGSPTKKIEIIYTATGAKLRKVVTNGSTKTVYDYHNGIEYKNGNLTAIYHAEGRATPVGADFQYEYTIKDHLGNGRVYFTDKATLNTINKQDILQESHYYAFGMEYDVYPWNNTNENKYQYNGMEIQSDFDLNLSFAKYRTYDATIGRWLQTDPRPNYKISLYAGMENNPIKYSDWLGDTIRAVNATTGQRAAGLIRGAFNSMGMRGYEMSKLISLSNDGQTFNTISRKAFNKATRGMLQEQRAIANGYYKAINSEKTHLVEVVNRSEKISDIGKRTLAVQSGFDKYSTGQDVMNTDGGGRSIPAIWDGNLVRGNDNAGSYNIIVQNPTGNEAYNNISLPKDVYQIFTHELLGHGLNGTNEQSIQVSNTYLRATGVNSYYRTGANHGAVFSGSSPNDIPSYLKDSLLWEKE